VVILVLYCSGVIGSDESPPQSPDIPSVCLLAVDRQSLGWGVK